MIFGGGILNREELIEYALSEHGAQPEYLWKKYPNYFVLRHAVGGKWFAVVMDIPKNRLGLDGNEAVYIADLKCGPLLGGSYLGKEGFFPAYHMNKENWISVLLDGTVSREDMIFLLETSYDLTK